MNRPSPIATTARTRGTPPPPAFYSLRALVPRPATRYRPLPATPAVPALPASQNTHGFSARLIDSY